MLRASAHTVAVLSLVLPAAYFAYFSASFGKWAAAQGGPVCGMPQFAAFGISLLGVATLSFVALALAVAAFVRTPVPCSTASKVELLLVSAPLIVSAGAFLWFISA